MVDLLLAMGNPELVCCVGTKIITSILTASPREGKNTNNMLWYTVRKTVKWYNMYNARDS